MRNDSIANYNSVTPNSELRIPNAKGFTLIEIIITLVVLSIAAVGVLSVFTTGIRESADPLVLNQAIALAQEKMDETIALKKSGGFGAVVSVASGPFVPVVAGFTWSRTVNCVTAANNLAPSGIPPCPPAVANYALVTVTVTSIVTGNVNVVSLLTNY
jgi:prepilin-type N-terminal cleavage/methylation domain-containing protein